MAAHCMVLLFAICQLMSTAGLTAAPPEVLLRLADGEGAAQLSIDPSDLAAASSDFGGMVSALPAAVMRPAGSTRYVVSLVRASYLGAGFPVAARGGGHSTSGQALAPCGVVIEMSSDRSQLRRRPLPEYSPERGEYYVDAWGGDLWIDVLNWTLANGGLAPKSWTDYLYLSVGGTLSNAGISGQAFHHGPQISNVFELDVVTGKGELITCSEEQNSELFHGVLGGLGQFGIITRARIALEKAPKRVRWIRVLYSDFVAFTGDQEQLISLHGAGRFDYVEGFVIVEEGLINNWRSSFFSPANPVKISSFSGGDGLLYCLEMAKNYDDDSDGSADGIDEVVAELLRGLRFLPSSVFTSDLPYVEFLDRVHRAEVKLRAKGLWEVPHPWLNLFVPASRIAEFDRGVFRRLLGEKPGGPVLIYPMNKNKWDNRTSAVTPDENVFYLIGFLRSALPNSDDSTQSLERLTRQNKDIIEFCREAGFDIKEYLPHRRSQTEWARHFGTKWDQFLQRKDRFDPKRILATGQGIFEPFSPLYSFLLPS